MQILIKKKKKRLGLVVFYLWRESLTVEGLHVKYVIIVSYPFQLFFFSIIITNCFSLPSCTSEKKHKLIRERDTKIGIRCFSECYCRLTSPAASLNIRRQKIRCRIFANSPNVTLSFFVCLSSCLSVPLSVFLSICLPTVRPSLYLSVCLCVCLCLISDPRTPSLQLYPPFSSPNLLYLSYFLPRGQGQLS